MEQVRTEGRPDEVKGSPAAGLERALASMKKAVWILAILTALVCAFSVVNVMISGKALEGVQRYMVSIGELNESLKEIQETSAELKQMIEELSGAEEEVEQGEPGDISNGKI